MHRPTFTSAQLTALHVNLNLAFLTFAYPVGVSLGSSQNEFNDSLLLSCCTVQLIPHWLIPLYGFIFVQHMCTVPEY